MQSENAGDRLGTELGTALDEWADEISALEPQVRKQIVAGIGRLAGNRRLKKSDREFAQAQVDAMNKSAGRAIARKRKRRKKQKH